MRPPVATVALLLSAAAAAAAPPNVILLLLDDQDSLLGRGLDVMPHYKQRFVDGGMTFLNAFVASPKCCPSRTSLLAGRFSHRLNDATLGWCGDFMSAARYNQTFMANVKEQGYQTGYFGKFINSMSELCPKKGGRGIVPAGFDVAKGDAFVAMCNEAYYNVTWTVNGVITPTGDGPSDYSQAFLGNASLPWITHAASAASTGGPPFFAFLAPHAPHLPAQPAPWHANAPLPSYTAPRLPSWNAFSAGKSWNVAQDALTPFSNDTIRGIDTHYVNRQRSLLAVDDYVRDIFAALEAAGVLDNTYVAASSDHGCV